MVKDYLSFIVINGFVDLFSTLMNMPAPLRSYMEEEKEPVLEAVSCEISVVQQGPTGKGNHGRPTRTISYNIRIPQCPNNPSRIHQTSARRKSRPGETVPTSLYPNTRHSVGGWWPAERECDLSIDSHIARWIAELAYGQTELEFDP